MARYQVILAYDGTQFLGSQRQAESRTVQSELEKALRKLGWSGRSVMLAGRTDTGVHASGQVAAFDLDWEHAESDLLRALNASLPLDMAARDVCIAPAKFHPRFDASSRRYRYRLFCEPVRDPLREKFAWRVWPQIDGNALKEAAGLFVGQHDFAAFGTPPRAGSSTVRTVMSACWQVRDDEWHFEVQANAFLYRMVRRLVFVQVVFAQGKVSAEAIARSLAGQTEGAILSSFSPALPSGPGTEDRGPSTSMDIAVLRQAQGYRLPAGLAPAHGLTLVEVTYPVETPGS